jgi:hypothetical protein
METTIVKPDGTKITISSKDEKFIKKLKNEILKQIDEEQEQVLMKVEKVEKINL